MIKFELQSIKNHVKLRTFDQNKIKQINGRKAIP